jgi:glycerophosphoryl diester phosphodiesterase
MRRHPITVRETLAWGAAAALAVATATLAMQLARALKSPAPAAWNAYSAAANDHLYDRLNAARPEPGVIVAHQGGSAPAPDMPEPGPIARLDASYARGLRLFELDLAWTADDELVIQHDWNGRPRPPTRAAFLAEAPGRRASLDMVYDWLAAHADAFIVTDCKKRSLECCARIRMERPELVPQFIVQIYTLKDHELVRSQGFRHVILTLYRTLAAEPAARLVDFVSAHELFALTIPRRRADDADLIAGVRRLGVPVYVHTINDAAEARELVGRGATGVYSDSLTSLESRGADGQPARPRK